MIGQLDVTCGGGASVVIVPRLEAHAVVVLT
jgi:hypothetical protein